MRKKINCYSKNSIDSGLYQSRGERTSQSLVSDNQMAHIDIHCYYVKQTAKDGDLVARLFISISLFNTAKCAVK